MAKNGPVADLESGTPQQPAGNGLRPCVEGPAVQRFLITSPVVDEGVNHAVGLRGGLLGKPIEDRFILGR